MQAIPSLGTAGAVGSVYPIMDLGAARSLARLAERTSPFLLTAALFTCYAIAFAVRLRRERHRITAGGRRPPASEGRP